MKKLYIDDACSFLFVKNYVPKTIKKLLKSEIQKGLYKAQKDYLKETYNISLEKIIDVFIDNLDIEHIPGNYILYLNENRYINKNKIITLVELINYGNLKISGTQLFNNIIDYISNKLSSLYDIFNIEIMKEMK